MSKKNIFLLCLIVALAGVFLYVNRRWFVAEKVQISHRAGPPLRFSRFGTQNNNKAVVPLFFEFNRKLKLTSVKVVPLSALETNKYTVPLWEIVPESQPVETKGFQYGGKIPGMKPSVPNAVPDPLEPGVKYRLIVEAGSLKAEYDFTPQASKR